MIDFGIKDIIDIVCVALLLYYVYKLMKESGSLNVFYGILVFIVMWILVSQVFEMKLLQSIFDRLMSVGVLALIILFQEEIRRFFLTIGSQRKLGFITRLFMRKRKKNNTSEENPAVMKIVRACEQMSKNKVGALIIIEHRMSLTDIINSGEKVDAIISAPLIQNIFFKNSPLHDGAMIISHNRITAAGCILPVSHDMNIPKELGLRHRAALGISQQSDALAVVVSEENGAISIARRGELQHRVATEDLESQIAEII
ncbi:MAG: diadenylate cyclase CdaA [Bacteroidaceae bacterium]|nr:diadenylate cyclase CdaA [Bacteroidaceae bacterium]